MPGRKGPRRGRCGLRALPDAPGCIGHTHVRLGHGTGSLGPCFRQRSHVRWRLKRGLLWAGQPTVPGSPFWGVAAFQNEGKGGDSGIPGKGNIS